MFMAIKQLLDEYLLNTRTLYKKNNESKSKYDNREEKHNHFMTNFLEA